MSIRVGLASSSLKGQRILLEQFHEVVRVPGKIVSIGYHLPLEAGVLVGCRLKDFTITLS